MMEDPSARQPPAVRARLSAELESRIEISVRDAIAKYGTEDGERAFACAFSDIYEVIFNRVFRAGVDWDVAEEIVSTAAMNAFEGLDSYDPGRPFVAWFWTIARNLLRSYLRATRGRGKAPRPAMEGLDSTRHAHVSVAPEDPGVRLDYSRWLSRLPLQHQRFLNLLADGHSVPEAADLVGRSERWGYNLKRKLKAEVQQLLEG
jgi:RNA polymerase sigma factor (sigma-70 family)